MTTSQTPDALAFRGGHLPNDPRHGTVGGYTSLGCRCAKCKVAARDKMRRLRAERGALNGAIPERLHGTITGYTSWGCRCSKCRAASAERARERRMLRRGHEEEVAAWPMPSIGGPVHAIYGGRHLGTLVGVSYRSDLVLVLAPDGARRSFPFHRVRAA